MTKTEVKAPVKIGSIVRETPVTWPPSAPDEAPADTRSVLVETEIPVALPEVHAPMVTPDIATANAPATTAATEVSATELEPVALIDAAEPASCVGASPAWKKPFR